ncbi:MAG: hypothetical protein KA383_04815 [Phycisphaerae bacterium]|nr:hypothetical protein [Phycisphaerae bacterium]
MSALRHNAVVRAGLLAAMGCAVLLAGCQAPSGPIFPTVSPPIVWPAPPDRPRIRYIGELRGEASLGARPSGWEAFQAALAGPRAQAEFSRPAAVAVAGERVFVADTGLGSVHLLDLAARRYTTIRGSPSDPLRVPIDVSVGDGTQLYVVDRGRAAVDVFDLDGRWRATHRWPELTAPVAIAWDARGRRFWLADAAAHACFATTDWRTLEQRVGQRGSAPGQFNFPTALAAQPDIGLIVADAMNFRVQVFGADATPVRVFGQKGDAAGDFARPRAVAVDSDQHIYVVDNQFENIQIFDRDGRLLLAFGQEGARPGEFALPGGLTIDAQDRIWVADGYNRRVQVFQYLSEKAS